jgi:hypothetical protein
MGMGVLMFSEQEKGIIIMALMYFKSDCSVTDIKNLGFDINDHGVGECDDMVQVLIEDFIGPVWDEEATAENIKTETRTRKI